MNVKKILVILELLNELAKDEQINFSATLTEALKVRYMIKIKAVILISNKCFARIQIILQILSVTLVHLVFCVYWYS